jgi:hypothetical protein
MTDKEIRKSVAEVAILNDLLELRLVELNEQEIGHKNLKIAYNQSVKAAKKLTKVNNSKLKERSEVFGEMYDAVNELLADIFNKIEA